MYLVVGHMLRQEAKVEVEVAAVDNMGSLDPVQVPALGMVKQVGMDHMVEGLILREVGKVEVVVVDKMVDLVVGLVLVWDMVVDMLMQATKVEVVGVDKMVGLDRALVQAQDMVLIG
jgi:hypothetical protein